MGSVLERVIEDPANVLTLAGKAPDTWQAELLRGKARRMLLLCSRQAGKSTTAAALALREALPNPNRLVLLLSPSLRQSGELFRDKVMRLYEGLGRPVPAVQESALQVQFANGSRIISLPGDEETIRGYSGVALLIIDEASRVLDSLYYAVRPMLAVSGGTLVALTTPFGRRGWFYHEWQGESSWARVRITAEQCPRISPEFLAEERRTMGPDWYAQEYLCEFTEGGRDPMFPGPWLDRAEKVGATLAGRKRSARAIGVDPAEGGDSTAWAVVDEFGLIFLLSLKTPDTTAVTARTLALMREFSVSAEKVVFDRGGGGKEHADRLRLAGHAVRTVAFGEAATAENERTVIGGSRSAYKNRRAEMYGELRMLLDPSREKGFGIPASYGTIRRQLSPIPLTYDGEGRLELLPKHRRSSADNRQSLTDLIGHSPDEADALALAIHGMLHAPERPRAGAR